MDYFVCLGPNKRYIPEGKWDEYKDSKQLLSYDLVFRRHPSPGWYKAVLSNGKEDILLGYVLRSPRRNKEWSVIPNPANLDKTIVDGYQIAVSRYAQRGFATRLAGAEYLMRVQEFTDPLEW